MIENLKVAFALAGLICFVALLIGVARAQRRIKRAIAEEKEPRFSWALFIFSIYIFAQGIYAFVSWCLLESYKAKGPWVNWLFQGLAVLLLAVGISGLSNQVKWIIHIARRRT